MEIGSPIAVVVTGDGINCDYETARAFSLAGADARRVHINRILNDPSLLAEASVLAFPGGFSFGDDLGSGKVLSLKIKHFLRDPIRRFIERGGLVIGICNGFQALVKMGLLPNREGHRWEQEVSLTHNIPLGFVNTWVKLRVNPSSPCVWTSGLSEIELPIRHGEGRLVVGEMIEGGVDHLKELGMVPLEYESLEINGSEGQAAALCDPSGRIFGLMPHPEAFVISENHPRWTREEVGPLGLEIFRNAMKEIQKERE